jgi:ATP-binding cassette, subfamily B, bacterial
MNNRTPSLKHFVLNLIKPYKGACAIIALAGLLFALTNTLLPYMLKLIIDQVVSFKGSKLALFNTVELYVLGYIVLWVSLCMNMRLLDRMKFKLFPNLREDIMSSMFAYLHQHSHHYFQTNFAGSLINKIIDMQNGISDIFTTFDDLYGHFMELSIVILSLLFIHPIFAVILIGWVFIFLLISVLFLKPIQKLSTLFATSKTTMVGKMVDSISNIINVRLFARHIEENHYVHQDMKDVVLKDRAMRAKIIKMRLFWDMSIVILMSLNLLILIQMYSKNLVTVGDFTFVISLSINILWNLWFLASQFVSFSEQVGQCKQALSIISLPHEIIDVANAKPLIVSKGKIQFHNVTFHYGEGVQLFTNKNVVIEAAQKVGLVGFSGSGKSTFVNLILRLFEVEAGEIRIDEQNIRQVTQKSLREQIALIPQDITLFHRTLMENIHFGAPAATEQEVIEIAKRAHCHEFITQLTEGYQSIVGERGIKLSGGQRQRIAIARAMLKNAPILILDEATSALDSITEDYIKEALNLLMQNKTTLVIAHRLSTLAEMDRILVFENGKIIEDGPHQTLIAQGGHYAKMWKMQASGFLPCS